MGELGKSTLIIDNFPIPEKNTYEKEKETEEKSLGHGCLLTALKRVG